MTQHCVKRRFVLYVAGFDPRGVAHYHRLYREQAAQQAAVDACRVAVGVRRKIAPHLDGWTVMQTPHGGQEAGTTHTDYVFAGWDDIIRQHWLSVDSLLNALRFMAYFFAAHWHYLRTGAISRMLRLARPPVIALLAPLVLVLSVLLVGLAVPLAVVALWPRGEWPADITMALAWWLLLSAGLVWLVLRMEAKFHMLWLMRSYLFTRKYSLGHVPLLDARVELFAQAIAQARLSGEYDEVLVVGHSSGCTIAASAVACSYAMASLPGAAAVTGLGFVTLGHCMPLLGSLPAAHQFRAQLQQLSHQTSLTWVDFSAPTDGCCFALVDAIEAAVPFDQRGACLPTLLSPRFHTLFNSTAYRSLCRNRFELHFQYIKAAPLAGDYSYLAITAGSAALGERFPAHRSVRNQPQS
jgi:hypothetical protein